MSEIVYVIQRITRLTSGTVTHVAFNKDTAHQMLEKMINDVCWSLGYDKINSENAEQYKRIKEFLDNKDIVGAYFELNASSFLDATSMMMEKCPYKINFLAVETMDDFKGENVSVNMDVSSVAREEACKVCKKMNDVGVTVCWNCGNHP